jgi:hypothetical protein
LADLRSRISGILIVRGDEEAMQKTELQRIASALNQLTVPSHDAIGQPLANAHGYSFKIDSHKIDSHKIDSHSQTRSQPPFVSPVSSTPESTARAIVQPFPVQAACSEIPALPKFKLPSFSSHRHDENPRLALKLLKEFEGKAAGWQTEWEQILQQIQEIYLEGPIVDGWLESQALEQPAEAFTLRHAEADRLMDYVEEICQAQPNGADGLPRTGYRLCGLDADGKLWSRPCPPEQVPHLSLAIARYQRLRQLLGRKQYLETRLSHLSAMLLEMHSHLQAAP